MRYSIKDGGVQTALEDQLKAAGLHVLHIFPHIDVPVSDCQFAVYHATLSKMVGKSACVFDAWVVFSGQANSFYNQENYSTPDDAVKQHIGALVMSGELKLVEKRTNARAARKTRA
jgi:hypothetical protein